MSAFAHMGSGGCNFMMRGSWTKLSSIFIIRILRSLDLCTFQVTIYNLNILKFITKMCEFRKMINFGGCLKIMKIHWNFRGLWFLSVGQSKQTHKHDVIGFYHTWVARNRLAVDSLSCSQHYNVTNCVRFLFCKRSFCMN